MNIIHKLDKRVYNRIAAGEVIERPASVVKELVENSIDSGAKSIFINIVNAGLDLIEITDDGCGIYKDDLPLTIQPHATSKISTEDDLDNLVTLGFRGEALASISSISNFTIISKKADDEGYCFECSGGEQEKLIPYPAENGTTIKVENLFYNTPARLKFLKSNKTEEGEIIDKVTKLIFSNPNVAFTLKIDGKKIFQTYGKGLEDCILSIYGIETINNSFKINNYKNGITISGFIGNQNYSKGNKNYQTTIVNGRIINNQTIQSAIFNAYSPYLMKRRYPLYVLTITVPQEIVDFNVTPDKSDVRFIDNSIVYSSVYSTISHMLDGTDQAPTIVIEPKEKPKNIEEQKEIYVSKYDDVFKNIEPINPIEPIFTKNENDVNEDIKNDIKLDIFLENKKYIEEMEKNNPPIIDTDKNLNNLVYKCQILDSYLIFENNRDVYFVDQHAAHERLRYNKLIYNFKNNIRESQSMLIPYEVKLLSMEIDLFESKIDYLVKLGFDIVKDNDKYYITAVPLDLIDINLDEFVKELLVDGYMDNTMPIDALNEKIMQKACKSAVKAGMKLSNLEVETLVKLLNNDLSLKCPHGRPIAFKIQEKEIEKWFKRIV